MFGTNAECSCVDRPQEAWLSWHCIFTRYIAVGDDGDMILMHSLRDYDAEKSAARMAVQAAAGALMNVTGNTCNDIVMCSQAREWDDLLEVSAGSSDFST